MRRATATRPWRGVLALALASALLLFTTVYRHSSGFSRATAARIHALSADHTDARTLFAGDFGPLSVLADAAVVAPTIDRPSPTLVLPAAGPERPIALIVTPLRRPPPTCPI